MKQICIILLVLLVNLSANAKASGTCGDNLRWYLTDKGVLTIYGKGDLYVKDWQRTPWDINGITDKIREVIIGDSVTAIGREAFYLCNNLMRITIPNSVTEIGNDAFNMCI